MSDPGPSAEATPPAVGVIGGSGLYEIDGLTDLEEVRLSTPFGEPSDAFVTGTLEGVRMVFLPRHGRGHRISPSEINYRANVWGMKRLGVDRILGVGAVGSLREEIPPGDFVAVDQFIDRTRHRADTFFGGGVVAREPPRQAAQEVVLLQEDRCVRGVHGVLFGWEDGAHRVSAGGAPPNVCGVH